MNVLHRAQQELYRRTPDQCFDCLDDLEDACQTRQAQSREDWRLPSELVARPRANHQLALQTGQEEGWLMNDWSFGQLCKLAGVAKETVNRLTPETASRVLQETCPRGNKPLQLLTQEGRLRSLHGASYTRLFDAQLVELLQEFAVDFQPPQRAANGGTGLYSGEQDLFCFLIDPLGWTDIDGEAFAPGFFCWNSEVGRRSIGIQTFWFQAVCANHLVWDAVEVVEFTRKHTTKVGDALAEIRRIVEGLAHQRTARKDAFFKVVRRAMATKLGDDADEVLATLAKHGIGRGLARQALQIAERQGRFTLFAVVDALTRLAGQVLYAGDRTDADHKAGALLALAV